VRSEALRSRLEAAGELVAWPEGVPADLGPAVTDSRATSPGALFVAYAGSSTDSHAFVPQVVAAGAAAVIVERATTTTVPAIVVRHGRRAAAIAAALELGDPAASLTLLGVTGTNGKTTTVHILRHLFGGADPAASIGTLGAIDGEGRVLPGSYGLTTPGPVELQHTLATLRGLGVRTVAMEASSHSLDQDRLYGLAFRAAVFTNLTREHLDYHQTEAAYLEAKLKLTGLLSPDGAAVVNADDRAWDRMETDRRRLTFGISMPADVRAVEIGGGPEGMSFTLTFEGRAAPVRLPLLGRYNVENALGAAAAALASGHDLEAVAERLGSVPQVPGRMERLAEVPCAVLRDYAHTPDGLERALAAVRPFARGRLILIFGCGGDRDRGKRPVMGAIAARDTDLVILTEDNPRTEPVAQILDDMEAGMGQTPHLRIVDRRQAIGRAIAIARPDDLILLAGKGHETYQIIGTEKQHFDEREVVQEAVEALGR